MNKHLHRLVFSRRHGMLVAVSELSRSGGKQAAGEVAAGSAAAMMFAALLGVQVQPVAAQATAPARPPVVFASQRPAPTGAAALPVKSSTMPFAYDPAKGKGTDLSTTGRVRWSSDGTNATFDQGSVERVVLNWDSFNIGVGKSVRFIQDKDPAKYVSALNRIWDADPSVILGSLTADREVILLNSNGVYFGRGARVDTGKFIATSLSIADGVFEKGLRNVTDGSAVFSTAGTDYRATNLDGAVTVEGGAEIRVAAGGDVLLFAPRVSNQGRLDTPKGQTVLAAGDKVYLMSSSDPKQRGLIVAVDPVKVVVTRIDPSSGTISPEEVIDSGLGIVDNSALGSFKTIDGRIVDDATPDSTAGLVKKLNEIRAESGTVNLVGLALRQNGKVSATTAVKGANGVILLQSQESTVTLDAVSAGARGLVIEAGSQVKVGNALGTVALGRASRTEVLPVDDDAQTQQDAETFNRSLIRAEGRGIHLESGATVTAPAGRIELLAASAALSSTLFNSNASVQAAADGSRIVVDPGVSISAAGLRDVALDGSRNQGEARLFRIELANSPVQRSGPLYRGAVQFDLRDANSITLADVSGSANAITRTAHERSTSGGTVRLEAEGAVVIGSGSRIDVSGGSVRYGATTLKTSLLERNGQTVTFNLGDKGVRYDALLAQTQSRTVPAYVEGKDGGSLSIVGRLGYFGAELDAGVIEGPYQRGSMERAAPAIATFGRQSGVFQAFQRIRLGGASGAAPDVGFFSNALDTPLDSLAPGLDLSMATLRASGLGRLALRANVVEQTDSSSLDLGVGGGLDIAARAIALAGDYVAPGGRIVLRTNNVLAGDDTGLGNIALGAGSALSVAGVWTNDEADRGAPAPSRVQSQGGTIELSAARSVIAGPDSRLDVSAGAWRSATRKTSLGTAGTLTLQAGSSLADATLVLQGSLAGFDFSSGGSLSLGVPNLTLGDSSRSGFRLKNEFFSNNGFGKISVSSLDDVIVTSGTTLAPQLRNWVLTQSNPQQPSGAIGAGAVTAEWLDQAQVARKAVNLSFSATRQPGASFGLTGSSVHVERGAGIVLEPGGKLTLEAARDITVGATGPLIADRTQLVAPGGAISLRITGNRGSTNPDDPAQDQIGFISSQAIWLGDRATLSVAGVAVLRTQRAARFANPAPQFRGDAGSDVLRVGTVLGGGTLTLDASRGYVVAEPGSRMILDGADAMVNLPGAVDAIRIARPAGTLTVTTPEGFVLDGDVSARGPTDRDGKALADGGRLQLALGPGGVSTTSLSARSYPANEDHPRQLAIGAVDGVLSGLTSRPSYGDDLFVALGNGLGPVPNRLLARSGFDAVTLRAGDRIAFAGDTHVDMRLAITLDAPALRAAPEAGVRLSAPRVTIGNASTDRNGNALPADTTAAADVSPGKDTRLSIEAEAIDVVGQSGLQGFSMAALHADRTPQGEVRLVGYLAPTLKQGGLAFAGTLDIVASQVYATTLSRFDIVGLDGVGLSPSTVRLGRAASQPLPDTPLSAFGDLRVSATDIVQGGVLRQPFGAITLQAAGVLTLSTGSETSTSGDGTVVPFGTTSNLAQWFAIGVPAELTTPLVDKRVSINASRLVTEPGARVSARGGGDLQGWEFFPGVGGTSDYFDTPGLYAVLPGYRSPFAPRTEDASTNATSQTGAQIEITMAGAGLTPGRYTLLPARYALLADSKPQGAYLVMLAADQGTSLLARPLQKDDGATVVTGYITQAGSATTGVPGQRFVLEPAAVARAKSEIRLSRMSDFFRSRAAALGNAAGALPRDAGAVQLRVADADGTALRAAIELSAPQGARAGTLDLVAPRIALVDTESDTPAGHFGVTAATLGASKAGSVLLGGIRSAAATGDSGLPAFAVDSSATRTVLVATSASKPTQAEELLIAATDRITLAEGAAISAADRGSVGARELRFSGDGALAAVSANAGLVLQRSGARLLGGDLSAGAAVRLAGALVQLDATGQIALDLTSSLQAGRFALGARRIAVGGPSGMTDATVVQGPLLDSLLSANALDLRSYSSIDFVGRQNVAGRPAAGAAPARVLNSLVLDAPTLRGVDRLTQDGQLVEVAMTDIAARDVILRNSATTLDSRTGLTAATLPEPNLAGGGTLRIEALPPLRYGRTGGIAIGPGTQNLAYTTATLATTGDIVASGTGALGSTGDLRLEASRVTATSGAVQAISATGKLSIARAPAGHTLNERLGQGAQLRLSAQTIDQAGTIDLPSGVLTMEGQGTAADATAIRFAPDSITRTAGFSVLAQEGWNVQGDGGQVSARAALGRIDVLGTIDVGAARGSGGDVLQGSGGLIEFKATGNGGRVRFGDGAATALLIGNRGTAAGDRGGRFSIDAQTLDPDPAGVSTVSRTAGLLGAGGFDLEIDLRLRSGSLRVDGAMKAERIGVAVDQGSLEIGAVTLDADAAQGGRVQLHAQQNLVLGNGAEVRARSSRGGANGGDVLLATAAGRLQLAPGVRVDASADGADGGRIVLRAPRGADNASVAIDALHTDRLVAGEVDIEAFRVYRTVTVGSETRDITAIGAGNSTISGSGANRTATLGQTSVRNDSAAYMAAAPAVLAGLGVATADLDRIHLRAGVEVRASGNLNLASDWSLHADRPGGDAGLLTLRAAGNLTVNNSISDGFSSALATGTLNGNARSWSYRLAAGADLGSAALLATRDLAAGSTETGNLTIAAGKLVRTGAGSIELAAGRDILFGGTTTGAPGQVYVAGRKAAEAGAVIDALFSNQSVQPILTEQGGVLELLARRDIRAPAPTQFINNWLWRSGLLDPLDPSQFASDSHPAWWTQFSRFQQTAGSFGGGNARVVAGRDITNLALMSPTVAWADSTQVDAAGWETRNGGDLDVRAGGNISDGQYLLGHGQGRLHAGGAVLSSAPANGRAISFATIDGRWDVTGRGDVLVGAAFNPTATPPPSTDDRLNSSGYFFTYGSGSAFGARSLSGDVVLTGLGSSFFSTFRLTQTSNAVRLYQVMPESLRLSALGGNVSIGNGVSSVLAPSANGALQVYASGDVTLGSNSTIAMFDSAGDELPSLSRPVQQADLPPVLQTIGGAIGVLRTRAGTAPVLADTQTHSNLREGDLGPVRVAAGGSISAAQGGALNLSKSAVVTAGTDIVNLTLLGQHHQATDISTVAAGRNIVHSDRGGYSLAGPGVLELMAGRQVDLGASLGVATTGNITNASLPRGGAAVGITAGAAGQLSLDRLATTYLATPDAGGSLLWQAHRDDLLSFVRTSLNDASLNYDQAWTLFGEFPPAVQTQWTQRVLAREFGTRYLMAPATTEAQVTAQLQKAFTTYKGSLLAAGDAALATGQALILPGNEVLAGDALRSYLSELQRLNFADVDVSGVSRSRAAALSAYARGWQEAVAASQGMTLPMLDALGAANARDPRYLRYRDALSSFTGPVYERFRSRVLKAEVASAGAAASDFGLKTLPVRMALYDDGFRALELAGLGGFAPTNYWAAPRSVFEFAGTLNMTQSSVVTQRGGEISLLNPGGAINVGLKEAANAGNAVTGVIALGGGNVFGVALNDFQVNNQRVFIVGSGDMTLWSSRGDIDSGRGQNTAIGTPPLTARRSVDGVVFEVPATTTGSGLGILADASGRRSGTIGLYPAFGEILALDAFIRAPSVVLGSTIKGADNLQAASVGGAAAPVSAPSLAVAPPAATSENKSTTATTGSQSQESRPRNSLLTVDLLGLGPSAAEQPCSEQDERDRKCIRPPKCSDEQKAGGLCK